MASNNTNSLPNQTNSVNGGGINTNSNGKYVPPFRRNSVSSSHGTANGTGTNAAAGIASFRKSVNERKNSLEFANGSGTSGGSRPVSSPLTELKNHHQNHLQEVNKSRFNKLIPVGLELVSSFRKIGVIMIKIDLFIIDYDNSITVYYDFFVYSVFFFSFFLV